MAREPKGSPGGIGGQFASTPGRTDDLPPLNTHDGEDMFGKYTEQFDAVMGGPDYRELPDPDRPATLDKRNLDGRDLRCSEFAAATITDTSFKGADLSDSRMTADIDRADFTGANLSETYWGTQALFDTNGRCADVRDTSFRDIDGTDAGFQGARLMRCDFDGARLDNAYFEASRLMDCSMRGAGLSDAQMGGAVMERVDLTGADLSDADLSDVEANQVALDDARLDGAMFNDIEGFTLSGVQATADQLQARGARII
ncbi:pentapeptide repeat-containing protein [Bifidobacterium boum]|uniref:pentapeptide repeat-containing protein n=1 Tax=Bifidobacterium boum TaxID=78343 RepID=UPI00399350F4